MFPAVMLTSVSGCTFSPRIDNALLDRLKNRGPVQLSPDNPFLAANLMLAQESDRSLELRGFIEHRGAPAALEVKKGFWKGMEMKLYYPDKNETYVLDDSDGAWAIRGPENLSPEIARILQRKLRGDETSLLAEQAPQDFSRFDRRGPPDEVPEIPLDSNVEVLPPISTPKPVTKPSPRPTSKPAVRRPTPAPERLPPATEEEKQRMAEMSPRGDLVHYVTFESETIHALARWYTGENGNEGKIARMNNVLLSAPLQVGDTIVIPSYLVRNRFRLTESALRALQVLQEEERGH